MNYPEKNSNPIVSSIDEVSARTRLKYKPTFSKSTLERIPSKIGDIDHETIEIILTKREQTIQEFEKDREPDDDSTGNEMIEKSISQQIENVRGQTFLNQEETTLMANKTNVAEENSSPVVALHIQNEPRGDQENPVSNTAPQNIIDNQVQVVPESNSRNLFSENSIDEENEANSNNQNPVNDPNNTQVQNNNQPPNTNNRDYAFRLRSHIEFYILTLGMYILSLTCIDGRTTYYGLFVFFWIFIIVQLYRVIRYKQPAHYTARQKRRKYFLFLEWALLGLFLIAGFLRVQKVDFALSIFAIPGYLNSGLHCVCTDPSLTYAKKTQVIVERILLWTQVLLIALRADDVLTSWSASFSLAYYVLFGFIFYSILAFFVFVSSLFSSHREELSYKLNLVGSCWYFLISLYSWIWFSILIGLSDYLDKNRSSKPLTLGFYAGIAHSTLLVVYAIVFRKLLSQFMRYELIEYGLRRRTEEKKKLERLIRFEEIEEDTPYLLIISPSFYRRGFKMKKEPVKIWKDEIKKHKYNKYKTNSKARSDQQKAENPPNRLELKDLKFEIPESDFKNIKKVDAFEKMNSFIDKAGHSEILDPQISKLCYSLDDIDIIEKVNKPIDEPDKENNPADEKVCYICYENAPNAVFMVCGHGGICYECAVKTWRKQDICAICRHNIENILKVKVLDNIKISKVLNGTKKILDDKELISRMEH